MKTLKLKVIALFVCCLFDASMLIAQQITVQLEPPDLNRGKSLMEAFSKRASAREYDTAALSLRDLSDLLWAANGINRPEEGKRTAPSAMNAQDVDVYVFMKQGVYLYQHRDHTLIGIVEGDHRKLIAGRQEVVAEAPVSLLLVSDVSRFRTGTDEVKRTWAALDVGIVSQNISLFCASAGLATRPRASMDHDGLRQLLKLNDAQLILLNHPVSYMKK